MNGWTEQQDDQAAFDEAMAVADVSVRRIEALLQKLRLKVATIERTNSEKSRVRHIEACLAMIDGLQCVLQAPPVSQWRQQHSEGRGRRHSQQHVLECKLDLARRLLAAHGIDLDAEHVSDGVGRGKRP